MKDYNLGKMGRRRFVKVATALGISAESLRLGTQEGLARSMDQPSKEVSYVKKMRVKRDEDGMPIGREPVYDSIPRDEHIDIETASSLSGRISELIDQKFPNSPTVTSMIGKTDQSPTGFGVFVAYAEQIDEDGVVHTPAASREEIQNELPDKAEASVSNGRWQATRKDIPVILTEKTVERPMSGYEYNWDDVPGGAVVNGGTANATYYYDSEYHLITAAHVVGDVKSDWGNPDASENDGYVRKKVNTLYRDYALLRFYQDNFQAAIRNDSTSNPSTDLRVSSSITDDGIRKYYLNTENPVTMQGSTTGRRTTYVRFLDEHNSDNNIIHVENTPQQGDSGGIIFHEQDDYDQADIMGVISHSSSKSGTKGNTAESVENRWEGFFA